MIMTRMNVRIFENITVNFKNITVKQKRITSAMRCWCIALCIVCLQRVNRTYMYMLQFLSTFCDFMILHYQHSEAYKLSRNESHILKGGFGKRATFNRADTIITHSGFAMHIVFQDYTKFFCVVAYRLHLSMYGICYFITKAWLIPEPSWSTHQYVYVT